MLQTDWESIDESLYDEVGTKIVAVSRDNEYMAEMEAENKKTVELLSAKYPDRNFKVSKWYSHDFGQYQEVLEGVEYEGCEDCGDRVDNAGDRYCDICDTL